MKFLVHLLFNNAYQKLKYTNKKLSTGKSFSEAPTLASTNPQYDKTLFIESPVQYMKTTSSEHVVYINCSECQNKNQFKYTTRSEPATPMYRTGNSMNNLWSHCGSVDKRIRASDKDLPVSNYKQQRISVLLVEITSGILLELGEHRGMGYSHVSNGVCNGDIPM